MPVDPESLKRVLANMKDTARGFRKEKLQGRLAPKPPPLDAVANPLDAKPDDPMAPVALEGSPDEEMGESPMEETAEAPEDADAAAKLEMIRKLIGSV